MVFTVATKSPPTLHSPTMAEPLPGTPQRPREPQRPLDPRDFPGCRAVHLPAEELDDYEGRIEYWEARIGTAMILAEPATLYHEVPSAGVAGLVEMISQARGSKILTVGSASLVQFGLQEQREVLMQPDAMFFLERPWPRGRTIDIDDGPLPDVVLEVDHTTDVRHRKLEVYASWGFPEVWVEVPAPEWMASRSSGRPGLTIYLLEGGGYVESAVSRAFPGWRAAEIHRAMNEETKSAETVAALRRVGRGLGRASGTSPDDDPFLGAERAESRSEMLRENLRQTLAARNIRVTEAVEAWLSGVTSVERSAQFLEAAIDSRDGSDFLRRVRPAGDAPPDDG